VVISAGCFATGTGNPVPVEGAIRLQPNPSYGSAVTLVVETSYAIPALHIVIMDGKGSVLFQLQDSKGTGRKNIDLNISSLARGKYYVRAYNNEKLIGTAELIRL
jgi:hypothetical protein